MSKQKVLALWGGPGSGKSTAAAYVFATLKFQGCNVELVREYAKDLAWKYDSVEEMLEHVSQQDICAEQINRQLVLHSKVDLIITDSPLMLSTLYGGNASLISSLEETLFDTTNVMIRRVKPYNPAGRFQTEEEARQIDELCKEHCKYTFIGDWHGGTELADFALDLLKGYV